MKTLLLSLATAALSCGPQPSLGHPCRTSFDCGPGLDCDPGNLGGLGGPGASMCTRACAVDADCARWAWGGLEARCLTGLRGSGQRCMLYNPRPVEGLGQLLVPGGGGHPGLSTLSPAGPASPRLVSPGPAPGTASP